MSSDKVLYLHIGLPKTGTSFLQACLHSFQANNLNLNFFYPPHTIKNYKIPSSGNGIELFEIIKNKRSEDLANLIKSFFLNHNLVFISSEQLSTLEDTDTDFLYKSLKPLGINIITIIFIRDLYDFFWSGYSQTVKRGGETRSFYKNALQRKPLLNKPSQFETIGKVIVKKYSKEKDIFQDLFSELGLISGNFGEFKFQKINQALTVTQLNFVRLLNIIFPVSVVSRIADFISQNNKGYIPPKDISVLNFLKDMYFEEVCSLNKKYNTNIKID